MFVGAPLALAARPLGRPWLFYPGLALLLIGLVLPTRPGQTFRGKLRDIASHMPGKGWMRRDGGE